MIVERGQYSDAVLEQLESQNDQEVEGMSKKVRMLKDVRRNAVLYGVRNANSRSAYGGYWNGNQRLLCNGREDERLV
jgi:predicted metal-dependent hydrolase